MSDEKENVFSLALGVFSNDEKAIRRNIWVLSIFLISFSYTQFHIPEKLNILQWEITGITSKHIFRTITFILIYQIFRYASFKRINSSSKHGPADGQQYPFGSWLKEEKIKFHQQYTSAVLGDSEIRKIFLDRIINELPAYNQQIKRENIIDYEVIRGTINKKSRGKYYYNIYVKLSLILNAGNYGKMDMELSDYPRDDAPHVLLPFRLKAFFIATFLYISSDDFLVNYTPAAVAIFALFNFLSTY